MHRQLRHLFLCDDMHQLRQRLDWTAGLQHAHVLPPVCCRHRVLPGVWQHRHVHHLPLQLVRRGRLAGCGPACLAPLPPRHAIRAAASPCTCKHLSPAHTLDRSATCSATGACLTCANGWTGPGCTTPTCYPECAAGTEVCVVSASTATCQACPAKW